MKNFVNVNRTGRHSGDNSLPAAATSVEIAQDISAVMLDFDVYLMTSTSSGWQLLTFDEYLEGRVGSRVLALLCSREGSGFPFIESVRFVADVLGLSKPFMSSPDGETSVNTICMVPYLRPGQFGEYRSVRGAGVRWNVRTAQSVNISAGIVFRPSFDVCQVALDTPTFLYMTITTSEASLIRTCKESSSSSPTRRSQILPTTLEGGSLNLDGVMIQDDGISLNPCSYSANGQTTLVYLQMWSAVGLLVKSPEPLVTETIWTGLRSDQDSVTLRTVLIPQSDVSAAAPTLSGEIIGAVYWGEMDVPVT